MKPFIAFMVLAALALPFFAPAGSTVGMIKFNTMLAEIKTAVIPACGCCPPLWNGGIATTTASLASVNLYDTAAIVYEDGTRIMLECVEITPCIMYGKWLIGLGGVIHPDGDVLIYSGGRAYRWAKL